LKKSPAPVTGLILLAFIAFIALGLPDSLLGVGWPTMRAHFEVPLDALGLLLITGTAGYLVSSFFSGQLIARLGVGRLLAFSCALTGSALIGNTLVPTWWMMVALGVFSGLGAGAIDAGLNTFAAANFSPRVMQWLHASYGVGVTFSPLIMTFAISTLTSWRSGYHIVGIAQLALAGCFMLSVPLWHRHEQQAVQEQTPRLTDYKTPLGETLRRPRVWLSMLLFIFYTGAEVTLGTWAYSLLTESRGVSPQAAGLWTGSYWATFTIGRILAGLFLRKLSTHTLMRSSLVGALLGAALLWWNPFPLAGLVGVTLTGFAIAPIFAGLVSSTSQRVGERFAANTIGMQMSGASLGIAIIPGLVGVLAQNFSLEVIPVCLFTMFALLLGLYLISMPHKQPGHAQPAEYA
jgi:fucose permease